VILVVIVVECCAAYLRAGNNAFYAIGILFRDVLFVAAGIMAAFAVTVVTVFLWRLFRVAIGKG
jgi:hypothetical protein